MLIKLKENATNKIINEFISELKKQTNNNAVYYHQPYHVIVCDDCKVANLDYVDTIIDIDTPYQLISRQFIKEDIKIQIDDYQLFTNKEIIAGPCSVETIDQMDIIGQTLNNEGIKIIRGGIVKPRTSPYSFQGLNKDALSMLKQVKEKYNLFICSEVMSVEQLNEYHDVLDIIQIGTRNMQNIELLKAAGAINKPILLKRGFSSTIEEFLLAAEYIVVHGNPQVILCERGIRTFENAYRNVLDINAVPYLKKVTNLPVIIDPSHACGHAWMVPNLALAGISAGADGLMVEVHNQPELALSDGAQALDLAEFSLLNNKIKAISKCL